MKMKALLMTWVQRQELTEKTKQLVIEANLYPTNYIKEFQGNARFRIYQEPLRFLRTQNLLIKGRTGYVCKTKYVQ